DTTGATGNAFGQRTAGIIPYRGDSTLFVDPASLSMLVIDNKGNIIRVIAVPKPNDAPLMTGILGGFPGLDAKGRIVYRGNPAPAPRPACNADGTRPLPKPPDHAVIVRIDPTTRMIDTFATLKTPTQLIKVSAAPLMISLAQSPMPVADDWAILPNGTVAVV